MSSGSRALRIVAGIVCYCVAIAAVGDDSIRARPKEVDQWIQQLGDESFEVRENASRQLSAVGLAAKPELLAGLRGSDPEIRWRCGQLWDAVRDTDFQLRAEAFLRDPEGIDDQEFPSWECYRTLFGTSPAARQLFLNLQKEEPLLWEESASADTDRPRQFLESCRQLRTALEDRQARLRITRATALTVLFLTETYQPLISAEDRKWMSELWNLAGVLDVVRSIETWGAFKSKWFGRTDDLRPAFERLMAGLGKDVEQSVPVARELLKDQAVPSNQKQFALLVLAKSRLRLDDALIEGFLQDASAIDSYLSRGTVIKSQLRDVALVALIVRAGKAPAEFGFKYLREDDRLVYAPSTVGFTDDEERRAAFEKWMGQGVGEEP